MDYKNLTYKRKNQYLAGFALLFLIVVYVSALSNTISLAKTNTALEQKIAKALEAPQQIKSLEAKLQSLNSSLNNYIADSTKSQEYILEVVSDFCQKKNITLREFPQSVLAEEKEFEVETNKIIAEGSFINLLDLIYELEQRNKLGRVTSVSFNSFMDNKRKKLVLALTIYLQNIKIKKQENEI